MKADLSYQDELSLLKNLRKGNISAFHLIYNTHYQPLFHFANRYIKDPDQAEDIIADTFITFWQKREEFNSFKGLTAFLYTCTRNACLNHINKIRRHSASHKEMSYLFEYSEPFENVEAVKNDLIHCSIIESQNLPAAMKRIFQLLYIDGFTTSEIAEKLHISVHTVRVQKVNAIKRVRDGLLKKGLLNWLF
jgi:RNA polymerase sigma-70 factor (family 1)